MKNDFKYSDITEKIIGCAMRVHQKMKNGYPEVIYQRCMAIEFQRAGLNYRQEVEMSVFYDNICVGRRRVDFLVEEKVSVELKAISNLTNENLAQALNYLEAQHLEVGLLLNFGAPSLQFKRLINQQKLNNPSNQNVNPDNQRL
ncbi:MAG: GxxExxY protein [Bacteroidota bacterium]|nr:GxxExxY protein [Flavisolibacter sp.]MDQ3846508.1 GxxExxY protein [Bacteroidota bacterium]